MDKELLKIRKVKPDDARDWFVFGFKIWRDAYKNIFPEEVFVDRESKLEEKIKDFDNKMQNNEKSIAYVATYNGKIVGTRYVIHTKDLKIEKDIVYGKHLPYMSYS